MTEFEYESPDGDEEVSEFESEWEFYLCLIEDQHASILVDLSYASEGQIENMEHLVRLRIPLLAPREDGLCTLEESEKLNEIDDALFEVVEAAEGTIAHVGRITCGGFRDFFFYVENPLTTEPALSSALVPHTEYPCETAADHDPEWSAYFEMLYPSPREMQMIMSERVLRSLAENGDDPEISRDMTHWIFFPGVEQRQQFADRVAQGGFRIVEEGGDGSEESPLMLAIARTQTTDRVEVHDTVLELYDLAEECEGEYDGWETSIEGAADDAQADDDEDDEAP